jgi:hypothetical protein
VRFHDPRQQVEGLRDQLASHDKPLAFLIGAGASCAVRSDDKEPLIPNIAGLGELCDAAVAGMGSDLHDAYRQIERDVAETLRRLPNIEDLLSAVRDKIAAMEPADKLAGATRDGLEAIEKSVRTTIAAAAHPDDSQVPQKLPHHALADWISRIDRKMAIEIFTTNYDTLIERALDDQRVPSFDGFVGSRRPFFSNASLIHHDTAPPQRWARLWKIHGSVNWHRALDADGSARITRETEHSGGELIYPSSHKYDESRMQPYVAMLEHLGRVLNRPGDTVLFTIGYSFGDQHINGVIFDALEARERMHVVALQYDEAPDDHALVRQALRRHNLMVLGPDTAVVGGSRGSWRLNEPADDRTADLLDIPFDSHAMPDPDDVALTGRFRLGDFAWFARFLKTITGTE